MGGWFFPGADIVGGGVKRQVSLPDGSTCEVSERQYAAISELRQAVSNVVRGVTHNLSVVQNDGGMTTRQRLFSMTEEGVGLVDVADALIHQSKIARQVAAAWEGNVRAEARSYMEH